MVGLKDPYEFHDIWLKYEPYSTYLKNWIWITDGEFVEDYNCYKEIPESVKMINGRYSTHWMFPSEKIDPFKENSIPLPPNQPERLSEKTPTGDATV